MASNETMVMYDSAEAAQVVTVTGWRARTGEFWGDNEHMARYCGSTHKRCEKCGGIVAKSDWCRPCFEAAQLEKFNGYPRKPWDGKEPLNLFGSDVYFFDADALDDYCADHGVKATDLQLVFCEPNYASIIEPRDYFESDLPEDGDVPDDLAEAFDALNKVIEAHKTPLSWSPTDVAVDPASVASLTGES
jgi:hypothetical protein